MKSYLPIIGMFAAGLLMGLGIGGKYGATWSSAPAYATTYQLISERDGQAYVIDHNLTAKDCGNSLINESIHTVLRDAVLYCEVER